MSSNTPDLTLNSYGRTEQNRRLRALRILSTPGVKLSGAIYRLLHRLRGRRVEEVERVAPKDPRVQFANYLHGRNMVQLGKMLRREEREWGILSTWEFNNAAAIARGTVPTLRAVIEELSFRVSQIHKEIKARQPRGPYDDLMIEG